LQDVWLIEKLAHFAREVIPERRMHAKGCGTRRLFDLNQKLRGRYVVKYLVIRIIVLNYSNRLPD
jgi:catalase